MKIELTETEIIMILDAIGQRIDDLNDELTLSGDPETQDQISALADLDMDLREQTWNRDDEALAGRTFSVAEDDFINMGANAREQAKLNSKLMMGTQSGVDVWTLHGLED